MIKKKNKNKKSIIFLKQIVMTMYKLVTMIRPKHLLTWMHDTKKYSSTLNCPVNICFHWISFVTHVSEILKGRLNRDVFWISARPILSVYFLEMGEKRKIHWTKLKTNLLNFERNSIEKNSFLRIQLMTLSIFGNIFWI